MRKSAGLLMYRHPDGGVLQVLLAHPGGPFWSRKDEGAWTLPKGEYQETEEPLDAARREFAEETGFEARPPFVSLGEIAQKGGKRILAWAFAGDFDPSQLRSNSFEMEWPPRSGKRQSFPEVDRVGWFALDEARRKINAAQAGLLDRLEAALARPGAG
jgi:predicted NUDIX family NTP pyrophosphohydrolase